MKDQMKGFIFAVLLILATVPLFASGPIKTIMDDFVAVKRKYNQQKVKVIEYKEWGYNEYISVPYGWHVVDTSANDRVVILVLEKDD